MAFPLPVALADAVDVLVGAADRQAPVTFVAETWRRWLTAPPAGSGAALAHATVDDLLRRLPHEHLDRSDIRRLALEQPRPGGNRLLFIASMMWGRGKSNGRMLPHMMNAIRSPQFEDTLAATSQLIIDGEPEAAYRAWNLPGVREPFFTKWFWAAGHAAEALRGRPLVLDTRVWNTLSALGWNSIQAAGSRKRAKRYMAYLLTVQAWSDELSQPRAAVRPEDIEFALFAANGNLGWLSSEGSG